MFKFFKRKETPEEPIQPEEPKVEAVAELIYIVDKKGDTWVECKWNPDLASSAHLIFAELLDKVCNGETLDDALEFVREGLESEGRLSELEEIISYMLETHQNRVNSTFADLMGGKENSAEDSLVVKPSDILRNQPNV